MIALLSASWQEISQLNKDIVVTNQGSDADLSYKIGELYGQSLVLAVAGVGIRRARTGTSLIIQKFKPELIIFAGFGGALMPSLKVGDIVVGNSVHSIKKNETRLLYNDFNVSQNEYSNGIIVTESRFIHEPQEKERLFEITIAQVVDMETWGVVEAAGQSEIPVASIRAVSDEASEALPDMAAIYGKDGQVDSHKAETYFQSNPELLSPYLKFRFTNTPKASKSLCSFLHRLINAL